MSRRSSIARSAAALSVSAALLSACGTGLEAQTYKETGRSDSGRVDLGGLGIRNLHVTPPLSGSTIGTDENAVVSGVFTNTSGTPDSLTSVTSPAAATVTLAEKGDPVAAIPVPADGLSSTTWSIVLSGLTAELHAGQYISLTLDFANAGRTTVQVPVRAGDQGLDGRKVEQDPYGEK